MLSPRPFWLQRVEAAWDKAPIVWLAGVRRAGKTTLARSLTSATYYNCDLPSTVERLQDPEAFLRTIDSPRLVLDEIHQLADPSRLLKIAADNYPALRVLATGSSTLAATSKFRDSLTGRKRSVVLRPVLLSELDNFCVRDLRRRLLRGGLPQALLTDQLDPELYAEWLDSFFARDIQELFRVEKRTAFLRLLELLLRQSGGLCDLTHLARASEVSRPTVMNYMEALLVTHAIFAVRPFHGHGKKELVRQSKVYAFDTGFVCHARGWRELRQEDCGILWEHLVLETLLATLEGQSIHYWRNKQQQEIDFILPRGREVVDVIECKWTPSAFDAKAMTVFRTAYPLGRNFLVAPDQPAPLTKHFGSLQVTVTALSGLVELLQQS